MTKHNDKRLIEVSNHNFHEGKNMATHESNNVRVDASHLSIVDKDTPNVSARMLFTGEVPTANDILDIAALSTGLRLLGESTRELTRDFARKTLELAEFIVAGRLVDRNLLKDNVARLNREMKQGTFHFEFVQIITCVCLEANGDNPAGTEYRMNGQHVCWARLKLTEEEDRDIKFSRIRLLRYEAQTLDDMRVLYASIDNGTSRTHNNKINSYMAGAEGFEDCIPIIMRSLAAGVKLWLSFAESRGRYNSVQYATEIAYQLLRERRDLALRVKGFLVDDIPVNPITRQTTFRAPVVAAMFASFSVIAGAGEFWTVVTTGLGASGGTDPRFKLHNTLRESTISTASSSTARDQRTGKKIVSQIGMVAQCANCWNAWRRGEQLTVVRGSHDGKVPRFI
jgi:hypothetical protein